MTLVYAGSAPPRVWIALSQEGGAYAETAAVIQAETGGGMRFKAGGWQTLLDAREAPPDLIVSVGVAAFEGTLKWLAGREGWERVPVLAALLPRAAYLDALLQTDARGNRGLSAVVLDQPFERQLALIRRALPERRRVGVVAGPQTQPLLGSLRKAAEARGLRLVAASAAPGADDLYPALRSVLEDADVLLALPDPTIYNGASLQNILLTTYRARVPLVSFSAAYVKAGAVLAVYSTPAQVARQAIEMLRAWHVSGGLPAPQSPREFAVSANAKVAASLGLQLDDPDAIAEDLRRQEGTR